MPRPALPLPLGAVTPMKRLTSELNAPDVASQVRAKLQRPRTSSQPHAPLLGLMRTGLTDEAPRRQDAKQRLAKVKSKICSPERI